MKKTKSILSTERQKELQESAEDRLFVLELAYLHARALCVLFLKDKDEPALKGIAESFLEDHECYEPFLYKKRKHSTIKIGTTAGLTDFSLGGSFEGGPLSRVADKDKEYPKGTPGACHAD